MSDEQSQPDPRHSRSGFGSPECEALIAEATHSLARSQALWESAGFNEETLKAGYDSLDPAAREEYDRVAAEQKEALSRERRFARDAAKPAKSNLPRAASSRRTRISI